MSNTNDHEAGHKFLARLGKTRLRPGGKKATEWLFSQARLKPGDRVLEVACNMGTTAIEMGQRFGCHVTGIDMDKDALEKARQAIAGKGLSHLVCVQMADASKLPFADNSFDVVVNEAMLTMYANKAKLKLLKEYLRVLKPGGRLLTHDIAILDVLSAQQIIDQMHEAINVNAQPIPQAEWLELFSQAGFRQMSSSVGPMTLLSPRGLIYDEGVTGVLRIVRNALKKTNRPQFFKMFHNFRKNRDRLNYIAIAGIK